MRTTCTAPKSAYTMGDATQKPGASAACYLLHHGVVDVVFGYLGVDEVTRLFCTSKTAREVTAQHFQTRRDAARKLVLAAAQESAEKMAGNKSWKSRQSTSADLALQRFHMLVEQDILPDDEEMIEHMLRIPNVPAAVAAATVEAGQRFTYPQLLSAVKATVPGVEVWVKIYRHLGIICPLGMHPAAERLCCDEVLDNEELEATAVSSDTLLELMQFAVAMPHVGNANESLRKLCRLPQALELPSEAIYQLLQASIQAKAAARLETLVVKLRVASSLSAEQITNLLQSAYEARLWHAGSLLYKCLPAEQPRVAAVKQMLQKWVKIEGWSSGAKCRAVCELAAAQELTTSDVLQLMQAAVKCKGMANLSALSALPACRRLSPADVAELLTSAVVAGHPESIDSLRKLPAARQIDGDAARELLQAAKERKIPLLLCKLITAVPALLTAEAVGLFIVMAETECPNNDIADISLILRKLVE